MIKIDRTNIIWIQTTLRELEDGDTFYTKPEQEWGAVHDFFTIPLAGNTKCSVHPDANFRFVLITEPDERKNKKYEFRQFHKDYVCYVGIPAEDIHKHLKSRTEDPL